MKKEEVYDKIVNSEELSKKYSEIKDNNALTAFLSEVGFTGDTKEFVAYVKEKFEGEIDDKDLEDVAGGKLLYPPL